MFLRIMLILLHSVLITTFMLYLINMIGKEKVHSDKLAKRVGITAEEECAWIGPADKDGFTPFGPDSELDNIYQSLPQVTLHGMDEGLTLKLCCGVVNAIIAEATSRRGMNVTSVGICSCRMHAFTMYICFCYTLCLVLL